MTTNRLSATLAAFALAPAPADQPLQAADVAAGLTVGFHHLPGGPRD